MLGKTASLFFKTAEARQKRNSSIKTTNRNCLCNRACVVGFFHQDIASFKCNSHDVGSLMGSHMSKQTVSVYCTESKTLYAALSFVIKGLLWRSVFIFSFIFWFTFLLHVFFHYFGKKRLIFLTFL